MRSPHRTTPTAMASGRSEFFRAWRAPGAKLDPQRRAGRVEGQCDAMSVEIDGGEGPPRRIGIDGPGGNEVQDRLIEVEGHVPNGQREAHAARLDVSLLQRP